MKQSGSIGHDFDGVIVPDSIDRIVVSSVSNQGGDQVGEANQTLSPLGFDSPNRAQRHALQVKRTAEKAFML